MRAFFHFKVPLMPMDKTFDPKTIEPRISAAWDKADAFKAGRPERVGAEAYTIVIPPPNVTGSLHIGHALNHTLQDILCRFERMRGKDVLWQPGTDHAGIATQMVVERQLAAEGNISRREMGRTAFLDKVWEWKAFSEGTITNQLKRLGASCDFSRERFTMGNREEGENGQMQKAVIEFFVRLHEAGLLYKDKRLVNWDPKFQTAISDLEVVQKEIRGSFKWERGETDADGNPVPPDFAKLFKLLDKEPGGHLYYFDYPILDDEGVETGEVITVATTRPETMLGDTGVAVHPTDERYLHLHGKKAKLPLVGRLIPVVADEYSDPDKGTGAVKITPAHDFNDFEVGKRRGLDTVNILTGLGTLNDTVPEAYRGLDRFGARKRVIADIHAIGRLARIEPTTQQVPHGDRSDVPIEPFLTDQWYVDVKPLAERSIAAVSSDKTRFIPEQYSKTFFQWMENIEPWCVSRQLWWGHQIPAWYCWDIKDSGLPSVDLTALNDMTSDGRRFDQSQYKTIVARTEAEAFAQVEQLFPGRTVAAAEHEVQALGIAQETGHIGIWRDPDVLDTWFSSALWPFSTLGWPNNDAASEALQAKHYPNSTLVTGFDIIFFWVARMMMAGLFLKDEVPFRDVYIHGLVRDEKGQKMSKSKGNVIDPLTVIDAYGADALRFALSSNASQGRDLKIGPKTAETYRNFATKLWNAARFAEMNGAERVADFEPKSVTLAVNRWVCSEAAKAAAEVTAGIEAYKFNEASNAVYRFVYNVLCDWYIELAKPLLAGEDEIAKAETRATLAFVIDQAELLLHPFMPFITEALHQDRGGNALLALSRWPSLTGLEDKSAEAEIGWIIEMVSEIRSARSDMNVPPGAEIPLVLVSASAQTSALAQKHAPLLQRLAKIGSIEHAATAPSQSSHIIVKGEAAALPLAGLIDFAAEKVRLQKEAERLQSDIDKTDQKLGNPDFVARAPEDVIADNKNRRAEAAQRLEKIHTALKAIG
jgi:valyl-tRNA synthetase